MFSYSTGYYVSPPDDQYLKFKNRCSLMHIAQSTQCNFWNILKKTLQDNHLGNYKEIYFPLLCAIPRS